MGLLDRLATRKTEPDVQHRQLPSDDDPVFATKALRKFLSCLTSRETPVLVDLGPVVGSNVSFFGEQLGCKIFVEDLFADLDRHVRAGTLENLPAFFKKRFPQEAGSVDGILCWDLIDYLDRAAAQELAGELTRVLRPDGALLGFFGTAQAREARYTKFIIADEVNLKHRSYEAARGRQAILLNRDIIKLFAGLRVSDSFLLQNNLREILFRKPA
jgi:SAM-dependent methyltransferase